MTSPWVTPQDSPYAQIQPFDGAMFPECFKGILRTCGSEAAARRLERRDAYLIESYQEDERRYEDLPYHAAGLIHGFQAIC